MTILASVVLLIITFRFLNQPQKIEKYSEDRTMQQENSNINDNFDPNRELEYGVNYETGIIPGFVDWVAGGNFDGYVHKRILNFSKDDHKVTLTSIIIDQSHYDGKENDTQIIGRFEYTSKITVTCTFINFEMRGKLFGENNQYIVFSIYSRNLSGHTYNECYEKK